MPNAIRDGEAGGAPRADGRGLVTGRWGTLIAACVLVLAALAAYSNTFGVPFLLDDPAAIADNPSIRHLSTAFSPPRMSPESGRPLLNLAFAANFAADRLEVRGYHALNLLIHACAGLALLGIVRRTLCGRVLGGRFGRDALPIALAAAALWTLHPLQTEAVTYLSQRAESLMGLFYLLTLYLFLVGEDSPRPAPWLLASVVACLLGALTKEVIVTAPLAVLLYDRTFCAGSFAGALRARWRYYLGVAASWPLLALLALGHGKRGVGFDYNVSAWDYALTSCRTVETYLRLAFWPRPLVFDYGLDIVRRLVDVWPQALLVAALVAAAAVALRWLPVAGFALAWFLIVLAPTSSIVPVALQPIAEHRAYLALAAPACAVALLAYRWLGRRSLLALAAAALVLGFLTHRRNADYRSAFALWGDTVQKRPSNPRAHCAYGSVLAQVPGRAAEAIAQYEEAIRLYPAYVEAHNKLGIALAGEPGRIQEALAQFREAIRLDPGYVEARDSLGTALAGISGRMGEAIDQYRSALAINPGFAQAHNDLGLALSGIPGRMPEAIAEFEAALALNPDLAQAHNDLGIALGATPGREAEGIAQFRQALAISPDYAEAHNSLGAALARDPRRLDEAVAEYLAAIRADPDFAEAHNNLGAAYSEIAARRQESIPEYEAALRIKPDYAEAHNNLGLALAHLPGRLDEAIAHFQEAVRINPAYVEARDNLGLALSEAPGRTPEAVAQFEEALRLSPGNAEVHNNLGVALGNQPGRIPEAVAQFEEALRLRPDYPDARRNLDMARSLLGATGPGK